MERNSDLTDLSRKLRKQQTKEENLLWHCFLKKYPVRFRRQYVIGSYIVDFYCHQARLAVELDGSQHYEEAEIRQDRQRTEYLESQGLTVLRFSNLDVKRRFSAVCQSIDTAVKARAPHRFPRGEAVSEAD